MKLRDEVRHPTVVRVVTTILEQFDRSDWDDALAILARRFRLNGGEIRAIRNAASYVYEPAPIEQRKWIVHVNWKIIECAIFIERTLYPSMQAGRELWWLWMRFSNFIECRFYDLDEREIQTAMIIAQQYRSSPQYWPDEIEMVIDVVPPPGSDWVARTIRRSPE